VIKCGKVEWAEKKSAETYSIGRVEETYKTLNRYNRSYDQDSNLTPSTNKPQASVIILSEICSSTPQSEQPLQMIQCG
jgi:hypothetical protein